MAKDPSPCALKSTSETSLDERSALLGHSVPKGVHLFLWKLPTLTLNLLPAMLTTGNPLPAMLTTGNPLPSTITMHQAAPPPPEIITISIQPDPSDDHRRLNNNGDLTPTPTGMATLKPCDSAPSFVHLSANSNPNGDLADVITLNSANSVNSLIPRDELYLQTQTNLSDSDPGGLQFGNGSASGGGDGQPARSHQESPRAIALQIFFPFMVAGFGMVGAGLLLDNVQNWEVFEKVSEIMVLVPALLGLKGNLEMTLASRLSTQANLGTFDKPSDQLTLIAGNLALIECQAVVVGFLASWFAILIGFFTDGSFDVDHALLLCASSILTAASASIILGVAMVGVIMLSHRFHINPDNVATPIAASLGDVTSLAILAGVSTLLFGIMDKIIWAGPVIILASLLTVPFLVYATMRNRYAAEALRVGWVPVISAMVISSFAGFILEAAVTRFKTIAMFQTIVNGVGGNLVAIHASRISTSLHKSATPGQLPSFHPRICVSPCAAFFSKDVHTATARVLMMLVIPGHLIFAYVSCYGKTGTANLTFSFVAVYLLVGVLQVAILLYISFVWTHWMWAMKLDPDNCSIPFLTAFGDLFGVGLLTIGFLFLVLIDEEDIGIGY